MEVRSDDMGMAQQSIFATHIGGQDATRQQVFVVNSNSLACVNNKQLLLYKVEGLPFAVKDESLETENSQPKEGIRLSTPYLLHPPKYTEKGSEDDGGISAVAVDGDHELIAVCGRSLGEPASIFIYSAKTLELVQRCKAFRERGFSVAAFRGKFRFTGKTVTACIKSFETKHSVLSDKELAFERTRADAEIADASPKPSAASENNLKQACSFDVEEDDDQGGTITCEQLCNPEQVPLLAVVGWEGDRGETASVASSYLTLWNIHEGCAFLRLKVPALQVMSLEWSPFSAYQLTASGSRHVCLWTAVRTFTGLKLKGRTCQFGQLTVSDVRSFVDITEQTLLSGSDLGVLLLWEDGNIKAEMLQFFPGRTSRYCRNSNVACDQSSNSQSQGVSAGTMKARSHPRGSVRTGRRGSSLEVPLPFEVSGGQDGPTMASELQNHHPKPCHEGRVNSVFRDPNDPRYVVSAGADGLIKWWSVQAVLEAVQDMTEDARIAVPVASFFTMPEKRSITRISPDRHPSGTFWVVTDERGATWLFSPQSKNLVRVFDFHATGVLAAIEVPSGRMDEYTGEISALVTAGGDGSLRVWGRPPCRKPLAIRRWPCRVRCVAMMPIIERAEFTLILLAFDDGVVRLVEISKEKTNLIMAIKTHACSISHLTIDPTGQRLAVLGEDGLMLFLRLERRSQTDYQAADDANAEAPLSFKKKWHAELLGFTRTPEPLTRLIWDQPLLLLGVASDAALLVAVGLQKLYMPTKTQQTVEDGVLGVEGSSKTVNVIEQPSFSANGVHGVFSEEQDSVEASSDISGDRSTQDDNSDAEQTEIGDCTRKSPKEARTAVKDPLDLTSVIFFRRIAVKVSAAALRSVTSNEQVADEEAEISGSESEVEDTGELEPTLPLPPTETGDTGSASRGSLVDQNITATETRRVLAAAMKQQQLRRAAAAAAAAASARLTAITMAKLVTCSDNSGLLTWQVCGSLSAPGTFAEETSSAGLFLVFSGTSYLRNAVWCSPVDALMETRDRRRSSINPTSSVDARPLASLLRVLQQISPRDSESFPADSAGPHLTQIVILSKEGLLIAGTSDGRVLLFPASAPKTCAAVRVFDIQTGLVLKILLRPLDTHGRWALAAAAKNGAWWRCEFDFAAIQWRCESWNKTEEKVELDALGKAEASTLDAPQSIRGGQQQAEKQQQQQQLLRRLLMLDAPFGSEQDANNNDSFTVTGATTKKIKDPKPPCPHPIHFSELLQVAGMPTELPETSSAKADETSYHSLETDAAEDIFDPSEPTVMERHRRRQQQEAEAQADAAQQLERLRLKGFRQRFKDLVAQFCTLPGVSMHGMLRELVIHEDLFQKDEAQAAQCMEAVERQIANAGTQQQAFISTITQLFGGALESFSVMSIFEHLCVSSFPKSPALIDIEPEEIVGGNHLVIEGGADIREIFEAARVEELKRLLLPEHSIQSRTPVSSRRPTVDSDAAKNIQINAKQPPNVFYGPGSLAALSLQPEIRNQTRVIWRRSGANPWADARWQRVEEMAALLKAQPPEDFTDPQDEARISQTLESLDAYLLTSSGNLNEATLTMASRKRQQMLDLTKWVSSKISSFNRCLEMLFEARKDLLSASHRVLCGISEALKAAGMEESPQDMSVKALIRTLQGAEAHDQSKESLWKVGKQQLVRFLENRLEHLKNNGALFETEASKAEILQVESALLEVLRRPDEFFVSFEHLRRPAFEQRVADKKVPLGSEPRLTAAAGRNHESRELLCNELVEDKEVKLRKRLRALIYNIRECEADQSRMADRVLALQEVAYIYAQDHLEYPPDTPVHQTDTWSAHQSLEVKLQVVRLLKIITECIQVFDNELRCLLEYRVVVQQQLLLARLKHLEQYQELLVIKSMESQSSKLQQDLLNEKKECQQIKTCLAAIDTSMREKSQAIDNCHATEIDIRRRLQEAIGPKNQHQGALIQIFERKVISKMSTSTPASPSGEDECSNIEDALDKEEPHQQDAGDMEEDICPLGCDMTVYEALLELRDQKMANDVELSHLQQDLEDLKREYAKVQSLHRQHLSRYRSAEVAIHKFLRDLQDSLNELDTIVPLRASQIQCLFLEDETWQLPARLDSAVVFSHKGFAALRKRVAELQQEAAVVGEDLRQLRRSFSIAQRDNKQASQRLADLRATFKEVELVRFGLSLTLEQVEAAAEAAGRADIQSRKEAAKPAFERDTEAVTAKQAQLIEQQKQHDESKQRLQDITKRHTRLLHRFASARESDLLLSQQLQNKKQHRNTSDEGTMSRKRREELVHLKEELRKCQGEIKRLQEIIKHVQTKGLHIDSSILCRKDAAFSLAKKKA